MRWNGLHSFVILILATAALSGASGWAIAGPPAAAEDDATSGGAVRPEVSVEERGQLKQLREQLDRGELTPQAFATQVDELLGDRFVGQRRWGRGAWRVALMRRVFARVADRLQLTDEQRAVARDSSQAARHRGRVLALEGMASIRLTLTTEQRAQLGQLRAERFASLRQGNSAGAGREGRWVPGAFRQRARQFFGRLAEHLQLTAEQKSQIQHVREGTKEGFRALWQGLRTHFNSTLTPEQTQMLEQLREQFRSRHTGRSQANGGWGT